MTDIDKQEMYSSEKEDSVRSTHVKLLKECPIPDRDLLQNLGLFLNSKNLARILFMNHIYQLQIGVHGVIMDFGTRWGQNAALFAAFRGIYEPFNRHRKIIAFDTFDGFPAISSQDSSRPFWAHKGGLATTPYYTEYLTNIMTCQEMDNPLSHIQKYEIVVGDASEKIVEYLGVHPETLVSLAYFDFDIYQPTVDCLNAIWPRLVKGAVVGFDELNDHDSYGETVAFLTFFANKNKVKLQRLPITSRTSFFIVE